MAFRPITAAKTSLRRSRRFLQLAEGDLPDTRVRNDLRRAALVTAVSGLDTYMHWLVYLRISEVRAEGELPNQLKKLDVSFSELASLADSAIYARKNDRSIRPWVQVKHVIQKRLLRETFQGYDQVAGAFALAGVEKPWKRVSEKLGENAEAIKARLNGMVQRRNQIVHEGDITRASRPRKLKYNEIYHDAIKADIDWLESLFNAIEAVVAEGNPE